MRPAPAWSPAPTWTACRTAGRSTGRSAWPARCAAVDALREQGFRPARPIGVVNFVDEEGSRFGVACAGSRVITGQLEADRARSLVDADGVTMAEAMRRAGRDPGDLGPDPDTLARVGTFVELHIEQGRGLVDLGSPVAVGIDDLAARPVAARHPG